MTTAVQVQFRRGTQSQMAAFTGAAGEMNVDATNNRVVVQDGTTAGGWPAARLSEIAGGFLNKFRNGTMDIWQRGTSGLTSTTSGAYTADGWIVLPSGASVTAAQAGGRLVTKASLQVTGASAVTDLTVKQRIESLMAAAFCGQTVTVQAQLFNNTGGTITPKLTVNRPGAQDNYASVTADVNAVSLQVCAVSAWTLVSYTFQANAASYNGLEIAFDFGNNFGSSGKSVQITECDIRVTNGVPTGLNANPPTPELRPVATELALCQRYFQAFAAFGACGIGNASQTLAARMTGSLPVAMRTAPSVTISSIGLYDGTHTGTSSTISTNYTTATVFQADVMASGFNVGGLIVAYNAGSSSWQFSAEL